MPIAYLGIKFYADNSNRPRIELISAALEASGYETACIARDLECWGRLKFPPDELMRRTFEVIDASDIAVIDLTEKGVGVGIEAGYAHAKAIPVITIAAASSAVSETLRGISAQVVIYEGADDLVQSFCNYRDVCCPRR